MMESAGVFVEAPPISSGNEHDVHRELDGKPLDRVDRLIKAPNGRFLGWQTHDPIHVRDDHDALTAYDIPYPKTEVLAGGGDLSLYKLKDAGNVGWTSTYPPYVGVPEDSCLLRQDIVSGARTVTLHDLGVPEIRDQIEHIVLQSLKLHNDARLCADILGGECLWSLLSPRPQGLVSNLLVDKDGKVWLCDTRTFRLPIFYEQSPAKGWFFERLFEFEMEALLQGIRHQSADKVRDEVRYGWEASALPRLAARAGFNAGLWWLNTAGENRQIETSGQEGVE